MEKYEYDKIMDRLDFIEFRQQLLFDNDEISRLLFEYRITHPQYRQIMDVMEEYRNKIENGESCSHGGFENKMYEIIPEHGGDYHMCEYIALAFRNDHRWEEVFDKLYGHMPKYAYMKGKYDD